MTISGLDILFDHLSCLSTLSGQIVNISSANDFTSDFCPYLLLYHYCCPHLLPYQAVNISTINRSSDHHSHSMFSFTSNQTSIGVDTLWSHNPHLCYSYNSGHRFDMAYSLKIINQEFLQPKDWVPPTIPNLQKKSTKLPTMDI